MPLPRQEAVIHCGEPGRKETCGREWPKGVSVLGVDSEGERKSRRGIQKMPAGQPAFLEQSAATTRAD